MSNLLVNITAHSAVLTATPTDYGPRSLTNLIRESWTENAVPTTNTGSRSMFVDFDAFRQKIRDTANLPQGWDSGSAGPISNEAIQNAISLLDALESARISPSRIIPTCDDSILIRYPIHNQTIEWEFFCEGDNVRVQIEPNGSKSYLEVSADQISDHI
jgi:hypothetical protein